MKLNESTILLLAGTAAMSAIAGAIATDEREGESRFGPPVECATDRDAGANPDDPCPACGMG